MQTELLANYHCEGGGSGTKKNMNMFGFQVPLTLQMMVRVVSFGGQNLAPYLREIIFPSDIQISNLTLSLRLYQFQRTLFWTSSVFHELAVTSAYNGSHPAHQSFLEHK
jgi:hypothetical protein